MCVCVCVCVRILPSLPLPDLTVPSFGGRDPADSDTVTPLSAGFPPADEQGHFQTPDTCLSKLPAALHYDCSLPGREDENRVGRDQEPEREGHYPATLKAWVGV